MSTENPVNRKLPVKYEPGLALAICELIAEGKTLVDIAATDGMPSRNTIYRWLSVYPKFFDAYERAKEISAQSLEEEALLMARNLKNANDFTGTKVQAYNYAMQQLRWSAARRDPKRYGQQSGNGTAIVPIQINTTLNLGQDGQPPAVDTQASVYTIEYEVQTGSPDTDDEPRVLPPEPVEEVAMTEDNEPMGFGLPPTETQQLYNPPKGRPKGTAKGVAGRRKSAAATARSARNYAQAEARRLAKKKED